MHESACVTGGRTALQALRGSLGKEKALPGTGVPKIGASSERGSPDVTLLLLQGLAEL